MRWARDQSHCLSLLGPLSRFQYSHRDAHLPRKYESVSVYLSVILSGSKGLFPHWASDLGEGWAGPCARAAAVARPAIPAPTTSTASSEACCSATSTSNIRTLHDFTSHCIDSQLYLLSIGSIVCCGERFMHGWEGSLSLCLTATSACAARTASLPPLGACPLWHLSVVITGRFLCMPLP